MKVVGTYQSVSQMVRETCDGAFADEFDRRLRARTIVKELMVLRARRGLSQADVAEKMGCTQSRISKLESSEDSSLTLGDLARYASAVGFGVGVVLEPRETTKDEELLISFKLIEGEPGRQTIAPGPRPEPSKTPRKRSEKEPVGV
jgi:transcriptional regulator with XRE-family HTH domain